MTTPFFITLEGADGAGKSSHVEALKSHLEASGKTVVMTREPGGTPLAEKLRDLVKHHPMSAETQTLLFNAARRDHIELIIRPALEAGNTVICDRFTDSTYAYQGACRGVPMSKLSTLERWVQEGLTPNLTLYFDVPLDVSKQRRENRGEATDQLEDAMDKQFSAMRQTFLDRAAADPKRIVVIDGTPSLIAVRESVLHAVDRALLLPDASPTSPTSSKSPHP